MHIPPASSSIHMGKENNRGCFHSPILSIVLFTFSRTGFCIILPRKQVEEPVFSTVAHDFAVHRAIHVQEAVCMGVFPY